MGGFASPVIGSIGGSYFTFFLPGVCTLKIGSAVSPSLGQATVIIGTTRNVSDNSEILKGETVSLNNWLQSIRPHIKVPFWLHAGLNSSRLRETKVCLVDKYNIFYFRSTFHANRVITLWLNPKWHLRTSPAIRVPPPTCILTSARSLVRSLTWQAVPIILSSPRTPNLVLVQRFVPFLTVRSIRPI